MVRVHRIFIRHALEQLLFHFQRVLARGQPRAVADAKNMGVHRHGGLTEGDVEYHIGSLAAHAGQGLQRFAGTGYFAAVQLHQHAAGFHQVLGFAAVQTNGFDIALQPFQTQIENRLRRVGHRKQLARGLVDAHIGGLRRQQHGGQQLKDRGVFQLGLRSGVSCLEHRKKRHDIAFLHGAIVACRALQKQKPLLVCTRATPAAAFASRG